MIDRTHDLPITRQARALNISRGSVYYLPRPVPEADLAIMRRLDRLHLEFPFAGSRMLRGLLAAEGCKIGRRHVKTLMKRMGIEALYRRPRTTKPEPGHKIYPYLLCGILAGAVFFSPFSESHHQSNRRPQTSVSRLTAPALPALGLRHWSTWACG